VTTREEKRVLGGESDRERWGFGHRPAVRGRDNRILLRGIPGVCELGREVEENVGKIYLPG
jgi:hypothetical protein